MKKLLIFIITTSSITSYAEIDEKSIKTEKENKNTYHEYIIYDDMRESIIDGFFSGDSTKLDSTVFIPW